MLAEIYYRADQILDSIDELGVRDNTVFIWSSEKALVVIIEASSLCTGGSGTSIINNISRMTFIGFSAKSRC